VDYENAPNTIAKAAELTAGKTDVLEKVQAVYDYVVDTLTYDRAKAATVKSGYLPDLDAVLAKKTGICFDYASLMTGMLRSQGVPCKLVVGYSGTVYHAWINVYSEETGWVDGSIYFDGNAWQRMDPTFASSGKKSASIMKYIGNGSNYTAKYLY
jgi:transglutaminase-like putative cysteine protease